MRILDITLKDLRQMAADRRSLLVLLVMPIVFTFFFGFAFAGVGQEDPRVPVAVIDHDGGLLGEAILDAVQSSSVIRLEDVNTEAEDALRRMVDNERFGAVLIIPDGFSSAYFVGEIKTAEIIYDDSTQSGYAASSEVMAILLRVTGAAQAGQLAAEARQAHQPFASEAERQDFTASAAQSALEAWENPAFTIDAQMTGELTGEEAYDSYAQASPGMMIQFAIIGLQSAAVILVNERKTRALQRLLTTPTSRAQIIAGKLLSAFILIFTEILILTVFGQVVFDLPYYSRPLAMLLLNVCFSLVMACMGLLIGAMARNDEMVVILTIIPMFILSALGGAWFPLETTPQAMQIIGKVITPTAWAMIGYQNIILRGLSVGSVLLSCGIMLAWAAGFFGLAVGRLRKVM